MKNIQYVLAGDDTEFCSRRVRREIADHNYGTRTA